MGQTTLVVSGLPKRIGSNHVKEIANMSLEYMQSISSFRIVHLPGEKVLLRIGFHSGPCVAGKHYFFYFKMNRQKKNKNFFKK